MARQYFFMWMAKREDNAIKGVKGGKRKARYLAKDEVVREILAITPSAIHLR